MLDFFTVTCLRDIELQKIQLRSLAKFNNTELINNFYVIINDGDERAAQVRSTLLDLIAQLRLPNVFVLDYGSVVPLSELQNCTSSWYQDRDWTSSQIARLYAPTISTTEWSVALTSKDFFIRTPLLEDFLDGTKAKTPPTMGPSWTKESLMHWILSCELFGLNPMIIDPCHTATPFVFNNLRIKSMLAHIKKIEGISLAVKFFNNSRLPIGQAGTWHTWDIYLYSAWLHYLGEFDALQVYNGAMAGDIQDLLSGSQLPICQFIFSGLNLHETTTHIKSNSTLMADVEKMFEDDLQITTGEEITALLNRMVA